jgi:hypothetical protein
MVVHIHPGFLKESLASTPELQGIHSLFEQSKHGIAFGEKTKALVGGRIKRVHLLNFFEQLLEILSILQVLSQADDSVLLHTHPAVNPHNQREQGRLRQIYQFLDQHYQRKNQYHRDRSV